MPSSSYHQRNQTKRNTHLFWPETGLLQLPKATTIVREDGRGATCADTGGDGGPAEALLLDDEAGADEAAGEQRQDYPLHVVRRQLRPGGPIPSSSSSPHPSSPPPAPLDAAITDRAGGFRFPAGIGTGGPTRRLIGASDSGFRPLYHLTRRECGCRAAWRGILVVLGRERTSS